MAPVPVSHIGKVIQEACHLKARPLAVYGAENIPNGGRPVASVNRCLAAAMYTLATSNETSVLYIGDKALAGCCPGGLTYLGFIRYPPGIKYFVSTGNKDYRNGEAEYYKANPDIVERSFRAAGTISPPGRYLVIQCCDTLPEEVTDVRSLCLFGTAEQVRNLAALVHFDRDEPFFPVIVPFGPACSTLITYPAGLASNTPKDTAFMGPQDPTTNYVLPPDSMALGVPFLVAGKMAENTGHSFIKKRPDVAFPKTHG